MASLILVLCGVMVATAIAENTLNVHLETGEGLSEGVSYGTVLVEGEQDGIAFSGMVCKDYVDQYTANFLCRQAGFLRALSFGKHAYTDDAYKLTEDYALNILGIKANAIDDLTCPPGAGSLSDCSYKLRGCGEGYHWWRALTLECTNTAADCSADSLVVDIQQGEGEGGRKEGTIVVKGTYAGYPFSGLLYNLGPEMNQETGDFICRAAGFSTATFVGDFWDSEDWLISESYFEEQNLGYGLDLLSCPEGASQICECEVLLTSHNNWSTDYWNQNAIKCI